MLALTTQSSPNSITDHTTPVQEQWFCIILLGLNHSLPLQSNFKVENLIMQIGCSQMFLVLELFYLPEVLTNENSIDFGTIQLGEKLDTVRLPPWAENPVDFVHKHRMVLESEYASAHLHEWIDLIFGGQELLVKQLLTLDTVEVEGEAKLRIKLQV
ncbi:beige protein homolog 1-like [Arachis stenosperma]|uniref:beige protein homolog 1-like n=1 Tax=Arachis stenosperma TaxID=217475 RepID=UPI0025AD32B7|nr:beige protein homolog 1-like [Arachis stenosperma]